MLYRAFSRFPLAIVIVLVVAASLSLRAEEKPDKNSHVGTFLSARGTSFMMEAEGKEHTHNLVKDGKVLGLDGKECRLEDLKKGQPIRVTTKEGDHKIALKVEALKEKPK